MSFRLITVGIADIKTAKSPDILRTILGSCVGICFYDSKNKIGGLSHIMLPRINDYTNDNKNKLKYADTAIPILLEELLNSGAERNVITAKIIGGAAMFKIASGIHLSNIGNNNIECVRKVLTEMKIEITAEELGGDSGRTIDFYMDTGLVKIKSMNKEIKII